MPRPKVTSYMSSTEKIIYYTLPTLGIVMTFNVSNNPTWINFLGGILFFSYLFMGAWVLHRVKNYKWMRRYLIAGIVGVVLIILLFTIGVKYYNEYVLAGGVS